MSKKIVLFFILSLCLYACGNGDKSLENMIPADASFVAKFKTKDLIEKANLSPEVISKIMNVPISENSTAGINIENDTYVFESQGQYVFLINIDDKKKLKKAFIDSQKVAEDKISKWKGIEYFTLTPNALIAWDKNKLLITNLNEQEPTTQLKRFFELKKENRIGENKSYKSFIEKSADIAIYGAMDKLVSSFSDKDVISNLFQGLIPFTYISFNTGSVDAEIVLSFTDQQKEKEYNDFVGKIFGRGTGKHLQYFSSVPDFFISTNLNGDNLKEYLSHENLAKNIDKIPFINVNDILTNLSGDFTCVFSSEGENKEINTILVDLKDEQAIQAILSQLISFGILRKTEDNRFNLMDYYLGIKDKMLYITKDNGFRADKLSDPDKKIVEKINNNLLFAHGVPDLSDFGGEVTNPLSTSFKFFSVAMGSDKSIKVKIEMNNLSENSLAVLTGILPQFAYE